RRDRYPLASPGAGQRPGFARDVDGQREKLVRIHHGPHATQYREGMSDRYDAVIVGGGHNALVSAAYLARAGHRVVVLERLDTLGGAAVSQRPWPGVDARLSRYSYLVSLLPQRIVADLGLALTLRRRRYSSYTPDPTDP